jgi:hypothetical protein
MLKGTKPSKAFFSASRFRSADVYTGGAFGISKPLAGYNLGKFLKSIWMSPSLGFGKGGS